MRTDFKYYFKHYLANIALAIPVYVGIVWAFDLNMAQSVVVGLTCGLVPWIPLR